MLTDEIVSCVARFCDGTRGPTHDELTRMFARFGLQAADPLKSGEVIGKMKRVREVLTFALDHDRTAGDKLVGSLVAQIRATGGFRPASDGYAGEGVIGAAREAFRHEGYELDPEGNLRQQMLESLRGVEATEALRAYVRRAQQGDGDAALVLGTGKDLLEATARHVLVETTGSYPPGSNFPTTLFQAFYGLGLAPAPKLVEQLSSDPRIALEESLYILANAVNRLRNAEGTGHGRPFLPGLTANQARLATEAMGLVSQLLLDKLDCA